eukprot:TRINITY_DN4531_c1_g1_i1.p1 TRINITY_DN4531_c1_g1~~TRINITY_DN4531_c1_g1_i1.p1  ORF type:complete len:190 (+),score=64.15 TRINITY_DN4531_c1_g1_i1:73-642(+)
MPPGAAAAGRLSQLQRQNVFEVFELFNVKLPNADQNSVPVIELGDVTIGLRVLGIEVSKEAFRKDVLPRHHERIKENCGVDFETFLAIVNERWSEMDRQREVDRCFDVLDNDRSGVLTAKSLKSLQSELVRKGLEASDTTCVGAGLSAPIAEWLNSDTWLEELSTSSAQQITKEDWRRLVDHRSQLFNW